jgi:hypothetical protein
MPNEEEDIIAMNVHQRIWCVKRELCKVGISKDRFQKHQKYNYRGVDDVLASVSALHCKYRLDFSWVSIDNMQIRDVSGGKIHMSGVNVYRIINIDKPDEYSEFVAPGEGLDNGDKSSGKFSSYGYKNALFFKYEIPVQGQDVGDYDPRVDVEDDSHMEPSGSGQPPTDEQKEAFRELKAEHTDIKPLHTQCKSNLQHVSSHGGLTKDNIDTFSSSLDKFVTVFNAQRDSFSDEDYEKMLGVITRSRTFIDTYFSQEQVGRSDEPTSVKDKALNMIGEQRAKSREPVTQ